MPYRNFAERTREEYQNDLKDFIQFSERSGLANVGQVGLPIVQRFIAGLEHKGYSSLTRKRKVVTIRSFFSFLYGDGYLLSNIAHKITLPFVETTAPQVLSQIECDRLRAACGDNPRDRAIIELLLQTGIKLSELTRLTLNDVYLSESDEKGKDQFGSIRVIGSRSKKERSIPLNDKASRALMQFLKARGNAENDTLFMNRFGEPISDRGVQKMLRRYLKRAKIGTASVHTLRHTFGVYHLSAGKTLNKVKELMGLKDTRSTAIYRSLVKN